MTQRGHAAWSSSWLHNATKQYKHICFRSVISLSLAPQTGVVSFSGCLLSVSFILALWLKCFVVHDIFTINGSQEVGLNDPLLIMTWPVANIFALRVLAFWAVTHACFASKYSLLSNATNLALECYWVELEIWNVCTINCNERLRFFMLCAQYFIESINLIRGRMHIAWCYMPRVGAFAINQSKIPAYHIEIFPFSHVCCSF